MASFDKKWPNMSYGEYQCPAQNSKQSHRTLSYSMALFRVLCWALMFVLRLRFRPGSSLAIILRPIMSFQTYGKKCNVVYCNCSNCRHYDTYYMLQELAPWNVSGRKPLFSLLNLKSRRYPFLTDLFNYYRGLPWAPSQLLASDYMGGKSCPSLI